MSTTRADLLKELGAAQATLEFLRNSLPLIEGSSISPSVLEKIRTRVSQFEESQRKLERAVEFLRGTLEGRVQGDAAHELAKNQSERLLEEGRLSVQRKVSKFRLRAELAEEKAEQKALLDEVTQLAMQIERLQVQTESKNSKTE